jgi:hypothetical protein
MLAIAVPARREAPHGDGQHRRSKQRGEWLAPDSWWNHLPGASACRNVGQEVKTAQNILEMRVLQAFLDPIAFTCVFSIILFFYFYFCH